MEYLKVKDLIARLQQCNPEAVVCLSEKWGRGGPPNVSEKYDYLAEATLGELHYASSADEKDMPAIEITCGY